MIVKNAFKTVKRRPLPKKSGKVYGQSYLDRVSGIQVGEGTKVLRADQSGFWLGDAKWATAPFRIDMQGRAYFESDDGKLTIDAVNNRLIVNDGTNDRILIGYQLNGF